MPNIEALRQRLTELAPDGRDIGKSLRPGAKYHPRAVTILKLVSLIRKAKPKRNSGIHPPNKFLRMQLCSRVNYCDFDLHVGARVDDAGRCWLEVLSNVSRLRPMARFQVPATWKAESLRGEGAMKLLLLRKQLVQVLPLGKVYSVRYVTTEQCAMTGLAVQAKSGGALRLVRSLDQAATVAEELFQARFAELAGM